MQTELVMPTALNGKNAFAPSNAQDELADFSTDHRVLLLSGMALIIGAIGSFVVYALIWLIAAITNFAFYQRLSANPAVPQGNQLGLWVVLVPVAGALIIGLDGALRFGEDPGPRHPRGPGGDPAGRSLIDPKVAHPEAACRRPCRSAPEGRLARRARSS